MSDTETNQINFLGYLILFSFVSIVLIFSSLILLGSINNYALKDLLNITATFEAAGTIPAGFHATASNSAETYITLMNYFDLLWFIAFISLVGGGLILSYMSRRENYFSVLTMSVLGLIIFVYVGGIIIQLTQWFETEILLRVFPTIAETMPLFAWYLDNLAIVNLVLICLNIIVNFVDLDFIRFNQRKDKEAFNEI